jgi:hypothetical protein
MVVRLALQPVVYLPGALRQQEQPAANEDEVSTRNLLSHNVEERRGEADNPGK